MPALCQEGRTFTVRVKSRTEITIGDTSDLGTYEGGGRLVQVKVPRSAHFKPLDAALRAPKILDNSFDSPKRTLTLHACFACIDEALEGIEGPCVPGSDEVVAALHSAIRASNLVGEGELQREVVDDFARGAVGKLSPIAAFLGGVAAQEVIKACTHRFSPMDQFMYFDASAVLPHPRPSAEECACRGDRYDGQRAVLGSQVVESLANLNYFVVGAGAIGCELLKCFALMGVGCGRGKVHVTDMDSIERSNLNRQFLFRPADVGHAKSTCAAAAACKINPHFRVRPYEERVGAESGAFDSSFWSSLDGVANALDNVQARLFVDRCCVEHHLPLLESGTSGSKGNTQVVLPDLTESYGSSSDPPEPTIPVCTLKSFPYLIEHTLQWARDAFEGEYSQAPDAINQWLDRPGYFSDLQRDAPDSLPSAVEAVHLGILERPVDAKGCVRWALRRFTQWFDRSIQALLQQFPEDHLTESGEPFWSGSRRRPVATPFDASNPEHVLFVTAAARLRGITLRVGPLTDQELHDAILSEASRQTEHDRSTAEVADEVVPTSEAEAKALKEKGPSSSVQRHVNEMLQQLQGGEGRDARKRGDELAAVVQTFEKDDDSNGHMQFIAAASNLRAANYGIPSADVHRSKLIAGRIVPAIATTTACVVGLSCIELLKLAQGMHDISQYRNSFLNLALPLLAFSEPSPAEEFTMPGSGDSWTLWDRLKVEPPEELTLAALVSHLETELQLEVSMLSKDGMTLYSTLAPPARQREWMQMGVSKVVEDAAGTSVVGQAVSLQASCYDEEQEEDVEVPTVVYQVVPP